MLAPYIRIEYNSTYISLLLPIQVEKKYIYKISKTKLEAENLK